MTAAVIGSIDAVSIVRTRSEHIAAVNALVFASKAYWGYPAEMMELWRPALTMSPEHVRDGIAYHAEADGEIAGMYLVEVGRTAAELLALFVAPAHIRTGVGAALFAHAASEAAAAGAGYLLVESDPHAVGFYERQGCRVVGERDSVPEGRTLPLLRVDLPRRAAPGAVTP